MAAIISILCDALTALLLEACQTDVSEDDVTYANVVRAGRLQEDPTKNVVSVLVQPNDPDDMDGWLHEVVNKNITPMGWMDMPMGMYEVGGGEQWWRRFTVNLTIFFNQKNLSRSEARDAAQTVLGRAEEAIKEGVRTLAAQADDHGERAWGIYVKKSRCVERGGPTKDWIWDGKVWIEVGTGKP